MSGKPCPPNCTCGKHNRTEAHNHRIGMSVALTAEAKRRQRGTYLDFNPPYWDHP
jgi:hypothetical protein